ncbi:hypothetical protein Kosp01_07240 [Kocuria sp. NBRC 114282]|uniref:DUF3800 domain-containing protein n=1 Tax=Kocuria sp. NBRC 114282 TaxID=2994520 RepID=UPI0024A3D1F2|nr:DUF3800 domain-containing protein [Kocuria sp. NBRC 114282]GLU85978.1 hypothetical protein Kosp01_07240 [Kocuria sp. NBRC 114282]
MLLAYIDEIGEPGAFVAPEHPRFNTSPAFGYGGFVIPEDYAREFGAIFQREKNALFAAEVREADHPGRWERKGAQIFRPATPTKYPEQLRVFDHLVRTVHEHGGQLFYYADEKPLGTDRQTSLDPARREAEAMQETLNRLARHADTHGQNMMVIIDQINEKTRAERLPNMYGHILGRAAGHQEMRRIIEPPMHVDSQLSANIQFADWVAACVGRAFDYQLISSSRYEWVTDESALRQVRGSFTHESKLHLWQRSVSDLHHSEVFNRSRRLFPTPRGQVLGLSIDPDAGRKMRAIAEKSMR